MIADAESSTRTGRKGGRSRTPAKALAAKQNILLRWHPRDKGGTIPVKALLDGAWYREPAEPDQWPCGMGRRNYFGRSGSSLGQIQPATLPFEEESLA